MMTVFVLLSFVIALPAALAVMLLIRWSVRRYMHRRAQEEVPHPAPRTAGPRGGAAPLRIETIEVARPVPASETARKLFRRAERARNTTVAIYFLVGAACAVVYSGGECVGAAKVLTIRCFFTMLPMYLWPVVLTVYAVTVASPRRRLLELPLAFLIFFGIVTLVRSDARVWLAFVGAPTALLLFSSNSRLKTIAPFITGMSMLLVAVFPSTIALARVHAGAAAFFFFIAAPALWAGILMLFLDAYRRKKFSDLWFQIAFLWGTFAVCYIMLRVEQPQAPWWWIWGLVTLALHVVLTLALLPRMHREAKRHPPVPLLVLRVFGTSSRTQRLFEELGIRWRYIGPIQLIAGVDSVVANLTLDEVARYLTFRFRSLFVKSFDELDARIAGLDLGPDSDGRYRINDFFCFDDMWRATFFGLLRHSDAVLVDLGGFSSDNRGVAFELGQLLARRPLDSFVITIDEKTNTTLLHDLLTFLWSDLDSASPNAQLSNPVLRILDRPTPAQLVATLCDAAVAPGRTSVVQLPCSS